MRLSRSGAGLYFFAYIILLAILFLSPNNSRATTYYVNAANPAPVSPYTSWLTAATNIQDAIAMTVNGDTVLVTNGVYAFGGTPVDGSITNRIALTNAITVESVNGPWVTTILGAGIACGSENVRCAWLTNGASLTGFTVKGGFTPSYGSDGGGGVWCASSNAYFKIALLSRTSRCMAAAFIKAPSALASFGETAPIPSTARLMGRC